MAILDADGNEQKNGGPWWAKDIRVAGPLTVIACALVYVLAFEVRDDARAAAATAAVIRTDIAAHHKHTEQLHTNIENYMRVQLLLMRQLCSNAAKSSEERRACFQP